MLVLGLLLLQVHLGQDQEFFIQASSSCLQAVEGTLFQNLENLQWIGSLHVAFGPWLHVGSPFGLGFQRKLWFVLQLIPVILLIYLNGLDE